LTSDFIGVAYEATISAQALANLNSLQVGGIANLTGAAQ
jgi:hypothetical protein